MGVPQGHKRKFKTGNTKVNNKDKDEEITTKDVNVTEFNNVNTKKAKKNILAETSANINENDTIEPEPKKAKKMNLIEMSNQDTISESDSSKPKTKKSKKKAAKLGKNEEVAILSETNNLLVSPKPKSDVTESAIDRYPILKDKDLVKRFLAVKLTNNQKSRIRAALRASLEGTSDSMLPEVIHTRIQAILETPEPSDSDMRKLRLLYNMLKKAVDKTGDVVKKEKPVKKVKEVKKKETTGEEKDDSDDKKPEQKVKGPRRVFIGNLSLDISKDKILEHFSDLSGQIKDVELPKPLEGRKSTIAFLEVNDEVSFQLALSKHHSMLDNRKINVLSSTQKNSKITKAEAKEKTANGQLAGSVPLDKKSAKRKKMKLAQKKAQEAMERGV